MPIIRDRDMRPGGFDGRERGEPATPGVPMQVPLTLYPTSNLFMPGHWIRLDVSSSNVAGPGHLGPELAADPRGALARLHGELR